MIGFSGTNRESGTTISGHPKADAVPGVYYPKRGVASTLFLAAVAGAILGFAIGAVIAPSLAPAFGIGMAMTFTAIRTVFYVRSGQKSVAAKNHEQQTRRETFEKQYTEAKANGDFEKWDQKQ